MVGLETAGFDVNGMAKFRCGVDLTGLDDFFEGAVLGNFPMHFDGSLGHAAAGLERLGCQTGPENDAFVVGIPGGDTKSEGIACEDVSWRCRSIAAQEWDR